MKNVKYVHEIFSDIRTEIYSIIEVLPIEIIASETAEKLDDVAISANEIYDLTEFVHVLKMKWLHL